MTLIKKIALALIGYMIGVVGVAVTLQGFFHTKNEPMLGAMVGGLLGIIFWKIPKAKTKEK